MAEFNIGWSSPAESGLNVSFSHHNSEDLFLSFKSNRELCMLHEPQSPIKLSHSCHWLPKVDLSEVWSLYWGLPPKKRKPNSAQGDRLLFDTLPIPHTYIQIYIYVHVFLFTQGSFIVISSCHSLQSLSYISQSHMFSAHAEMSYIYVAFIVFLPCRNRMCCVLFSSTFSFSSSQYHLLWFP